MSLEMDSLIRTLLKAIRKADEKKTKPLDTTAEVRRVEGNTAWVHFYGGVDETPVKLTIAAQKGDIVNVRSSGGKAWITGNHTAPPTDDKEAIIAHSVANTAQTTATDAMTVADEAMANASRAKLAAESAEASASAASDSATAAQSSANTAATSASSAGENASRAQAAAQAAEQAALASITSDTLHYLATEQASGVTRETAGWSTTVQTMTSTKKYLWTYHTYTSANGATTDTPPVITGTYGEKGADGTSVTILGSYSTLAELEAAHPTGNLGDAYMVGGDLYVWNGSAWENVGQIKGEKGDIGVSITSVQPQYYLSSSPLQAQDGSWTTSLSYVVGKYIWTRDKITYSDTTVGYSTAIYNQALTESCRDAAEALGIVEEQQEYFWHDSLGAHVLSDTDDVTGVRYRTDIKGAGQEVRKLNTDGTESVLARFGAGLIQIGEDDSSKIQIEPRKLGAYDAEGNQYYAFGDISGQEAVLNINGTGFIKKYRILPYTGSPIVVLNGTTLTEGTDYTISGTEITFTSTPENGDVGTITFTPSSRAFYFTFGNRKDGSTVAGLSTVMGKDCEASGLWSCAQGESTEAKATGSHAEGWDTKAVAAQSHAEGTRTTASGARAHAEGISSTASGNNSHAEGNRTIASANNSHAEGQETQATHGSAHAEGYLTVASGIRSHSEGYKTIASGNTSHAEGSAITFDGGETYTDCEASGLGSHSEGGGCVASGNWSHAQGICTIAQGYGQTAIGKFNKPQGTVDSRRNSDHLLILGNGLTEDTRSNALTVDWSGNLQCNNFYPVGSVYIGSTNTNPASILGFGTWELFRKSLAYKWVSSGATWNSTNTQSQTFGAILCGNTVELRFVWQNKVDLSDSTVAIATIPLSVVGLEHSGHQVYGVVSCDGLNAIGLAALEWDPTNLRWTLKIYDWVTRATSYPTGTGQGCNATFVFNVSSTAPIDSFCDEFHWKRTA